MVRRYFVRRYKDAKVPMYPYEDLTNVTRVRAAQRADRILQNGWKKSSYDPIHLDRPIQWDYRDPELRSLNFHVQSWEIIDGILKAYDVTKQDHYFAPAFQICMDWCHKHISNDEETSPFSWYDMSVGLRAYRLAYIYDVAKRNEISSVEESRIMWDAILQHKSYFMKEQNISFHNNHGYYQIAGQLALARRFREQEPEFEELFSLGKQRFYKILDSQFTHEGFHREHSPDYHRMIYDTLREIFSSELIVDANLREFADRIELALSCFIYPDATLVNFGDTDQRMIAPKPGKDQVKVWHTPEMNYLVSGGANGRRGLDVSKHFPTSGYYFVRKFHQNQDVNRASYLAVNGAFHSRTHKHADDCSFVWHDHGNSILIDSGRYGYIGKTEQNSELWRKGNWYSDPARIYCESTRAHNCLEFDENDYPRKGRVPYGSSIRSTFHDKEAGVFAVQLAVNLWGHINYRRVIVFKPARWLIVCDKYKNQKGSANGTKQWFHLHPKAKVEHSARDIYFITAPDGETKLSASKLFNTQKGSEVFCGSTYPVRQGWYSERERHIVEAPAFNYAPEKSSLNSVATLFSFDMKTEVLISKNSRKPSHNSFVFCWQDTSSENTVAVDLSDKNELITLVENS